MNIFQIQQDLIKIFNEIEENEGELTPELEEQLTITEDQFKNKIESYVNYIKILQNERLLIKEEQERLKLLASKKDKTIDKLKEVLIDAVETFGSVKPSGVKYVNYNTGEISVRRTQIVDTNDEAIETVGDTVKFIIDALKSNNQLDVVNNIDSGEIINRCFTDASPEEIDDINIGLQLSIPIKDLNNSTGYNVIKEIAKYSDNYKLNANLSKSTAKDKLKENGSCMFHIAKLSTNKNIHLK